MENIELILVKSKPFDIGHIPWTQELCDRCGCFYPLMGVMEDGREFHVRNYAFINSEYIDKILDIVEVCKVEDYPEFKVGEALESNE